MRAVEKARLALTAVLILVALLASACSPSGEVATASLMTESLEAKSEAEGPVEAAKGVSGMPDDDDFWALVNAAQVVDDIRKADERFGAAVSATGDPVGAARELDDIIALRPDDARYRQARARLAIQQGDAATAKTHWDQMDRIAREHELAPAEYWTGALIDAELLETSLTLSNDPGAGSGTPGNWREARDAALQRQIEAYERLADHYTTNLDATMANIYMDKAAEVRARLAQ